MRKAIWAGMAVVAGMALASGARAQNIDPTRLIYAPVDTSNSVVPIARPMKLPFTDISIPNFFPTNRTATGAPMIGYSQFPTQAQMPGMSYLSAFGYQRLLPAK